MGRVAWLGSCVWEGEGDEWPRCWADKATEATVRSLLREDVELTTPVMLLVAADAPRQKARMRGVGVGNEWVFLSC